MDGMYKSALAIVTTIILTWYVSYHSVEISVTGTVPQAKVSYSIGGRAHQSVEKLPFSCSFKEFGSTMISASAQKVGNGGQIRIQLLFDGVVVATDSTAAPTGRVVVNKETPPMDRFLNHPIFVTILTALTLYLLFLIFRNFREI